MPELRTERLRLRAWREADLDAFAELNADARVMAHFPAPLARAESDALARRIMEHFDRHGFGLWALEVPGRAAFIGFTGLAVPRFEAHFTPCVEIGWRLAPAWWKQGLATEAARAAVAHAFGALGLSSLVSFTVPANQASRRVMARLGMWRDRAGDFDHPMLPAGHPLARHVLYRLEAGAAGRASPTTGKPAFDKI